MGGSPDSDSAYWRYLFEDPSVVKFFVDGNHELLAYACVLYYDFFLTLADEIRLVWNKPLNLATCLFLGIRYGFLVDVSLVLSYNIGSTSMSSPSLPSHDCKRLYTAATVVQLLSFVLVSAFVATRLMALWSRNWTLGVVLFVLGLINPSSLTQALGFGFPMFTAPQPLPTCLSSVSYDNPIWLLTVQYLPVATSAISIAYEPICLLLTVWKTFGVYRQRRGITMRTPLTTLLLRDGSLYFVIMIVLAVLNIVSAVAPSDALPDSINVGLCRVLVPTLTTRFISHLRGVGDREVSGYETGGISDIHFTNPQARIGMPPSTDASQPLPMDRFVGSLAGDLDLDTLTATNTTSAVEYSAEEVTVLGEEA